MSLKTLARAYLPEQVKRGLREFRKAATSQGIATRLLPVRKAIRSADYERAARGVGRLLDRHPDDPATLAYASNIAIKQGEFTVATRHAVLRAEVSKLPAHRASARKLCGRLRETDPRWLPTIAAEAPTGSPTGRVLYLAKESRPFLHNGFCTRSHESLQALVRAGRDVLGVTMPGFPGILGVPDAPERSRVEDVTYRHLLPNAGKALERLAHDEYVELTARALAGVVTAERPAMLHVSSGHRGFEAALAGNAVARWTGIPWLYEVRSFFEATWTGDARYAESGEYYERRFATETRMMNAADLVVTLSGPMREEIIERHGVPADKVRVVPNAVDPARFTPRERDPALRAELGLTDTFTLGYVSNLSHHREGQEVLIAAVAKLRRRGRAVSALLVGDGTRRAELEKLARKLGVGEHVVFTGNVPFDRVAGHYAQIDLFVVPRVDDRAARMVSPMKPFEAMAMRVPLLMADLPALAEIAGPPGPDQRAHTYATGDADALAAAAAALQDAPAGRERLVETAATWVAAERSWDFVAGEFGDAYDQLLPMGAAPC